MPRISKHGHDLKMVLNVPIVINVCAFEEVEELTSLSAGVA
jgi:hypothetical protein